MSANPDIPFSFLVILHQDQSGRLPDAGDAVDYFEAIGEPSFPVTADLEASVTWLTPWDGNALPGKCVVSPEMVMLDCFEGHGNEDALDIIAADWGSR